MEDWRSGNLIEIPISDKLLETARSFLSTQDFQPAQPNYAATVMLVRDKADMQKDPVSGTDNCVEVFMLQRASTMAFVPNAIVFPGGRVDPRDSDEDLPWAGPSPSEWAQKMGCSERIARCIVVAAAREVFEESGVLLAGSDEVSTISDLADPRWDEARKSLADHKRTFSEFLCESHLVLRSDLLGLRSRWLTPEFEPRRYDTFFFSALLPEGQHPDDCTSEASMADWVNPLEVITWADEGKALLLPPTRYNLSCLVRTKNAREFLWEKTRLERIMLEPWEKDDGTVVLRCVLP